MTLSSITSSRHLLPALALALLGFTAIPSYADAKHDHSKPPTNNMEAGDQNGMEQSNRMGDELKLNDKQRELFRTAMGQKMAAMRKTMEMQEQLRELTQSDNYDEKKLRDVIHNSNKESEEAIVTASKAMHEFYKSLSAEQKTKLKEMHAKRKAEMKEHMKDHMMEHRKDHTNKQDDDEGSEQDK
jgi:Spy/CpxP family protein refolding chaperone